MLLFPSPPLPYSDHTNFSVTYLMSLLVKMTRNVVDGFWLLKYDNGLSAGYYESRGSAWSTCHCCSGAKRGCCLHFTLHNWWRQSGGPGMHTLRPVQLWKSLVYLEHMQNFHSVPWYIPSYLSVRIPTNLWVYLRVWPAHVKGSGAYVVDFLSFLFSKRKQPNLLRHMYGNPHTWESQTPMQERYLDFLFFNPHHYLVLLVERRFRGLSWKWRNRRMKIT